ncbi:MAG: 4-alpha-glucanotransferase [Elusimicrobiota bacterium]|nr:4-alpha-glucanotransferase [Elusimicrobiota bacterium]
MKLKFCINYHASFGQTIGVEFSYQGKKDVFMLNTLDGFLWKGEREFTPAEKDFVMDYGYKLFFNNQVVCAEYHDLSHHINLPKTPEYFVVFDLWQDKQKNEYLYTSVGQKLFPNHTKIEKLKLPYNKTVIFILDMPTLTDGQKIFLCSNQNHWNTKTALPLKRISESQWALELNIDEIFFPLEYKFIVYDGQHFIWQENGNYILHSQEIPKENSTVAQVAKLKPIFKFSAPRVAGVALPIFSLRSDTDFGVGDFGDLKLFIDWAVKCGLRAIQVLPVNDTTTDGGDFDASPYSGISVFALHPVYADLSALPIKKDAKYLQLQKELNSSPYFDYKKAYALKIGYLKEAFKNEGAKILKTKEFKEFFNKNESWLKAYAAFRVLTQENSTTDFSKWKKFNIYNEVEIDNFCKEGGAKYEQVSFQYYVQYILHMQLLSAANYAKQKDVILKGDIPIGVSPCSVDTWQYPQYFDKNFSAGAPPDLFSMQGQNWGFPIYNWDEMKKTNYIWWQNRLKQMAQYFDAYRVDHILGFFRIWEIAKTDIIALTGQFEPALPMTQNEIKKFGFDFDEKYLDTFISEKMLEDYFGKDKDRIAQKFLSKKSDGLYEFKKEYETQKNIQQSDEPDEIKEKLYFLASDVLFLKDFKNSNAYHPRIFAYLDYSFKTLNAAQQDAFKKIDDYYFYKRNDDLWYKSAMEKLPVLMHATKMLMCAEDLGMIPRCVPKVLDELEILGLEVERQPKRGKDLIADVSKFPYFSVCSISTHDLSMVREFWKDRAEVTDFYYHKVLNLEGEIPKELNVEIARKIIKRNLSSPSMLCIFLFGDWVCVDEDFIKNNLDSERINVPGTTKNNWRYRIHYTLEQLLNLDKLNETIKSFVADSGRA